MRLRLLVTSLLIAMVTVAPTWLSLQPLLKRALQADAWQRASTLVLSLDFGLATLVVYLVLHFTVGRPIERIETTVKDLARDDQEGGGLLLRLDRALRRLALDLREERRLTRSQLDELSASHGALVKLQAELVANDRLATVGKLASGVAHEVGNPLSGILGYLSVIRMRQPENAELLDLVARIELEVQRIDQIVRGLLELGRPSRGKAQPIDVRPVIDSCVKLLGASRDFEGVQVDVEGPSSLWLLAETGPLSQVLVNLLLNAAQAMSGKGRIVVRAEQSDGAGRVVVEDEGPGLSAQVKAHLFEPFFTTKAAGKGTGLGLAVSRHLLSQFEGQLEVGDRPGGGARFTIGLPLP
ncbi:MAG: ATP-binding protein [Archangium sp.]|nr:ATP-binding protein [Archangium sp.]